MNCCYCGATLSTDSVCAGCKADVRIWKQTNYISNYLYNEGLKKAKARDLSGARAVLQTSLKYNKLNTQARNLLGLVSYEMGQTVDALSEWVISSSLTPGDPVSAAFLSESQNGATDLENLNQSIKKFNQSLIYCREGNYDLAVIQLKKVLTLNPNMLKGYHLLALLYMREEQYDLAMQVLQQAGKIDGKNETTIRYMKECRGHLRPGAKAKQAKEEEKTLTYQSGNETIIRPKKFGDNTAVRTVGSLLMGAAIGVAVVWFLVIPEIQQEANSSASAQIVEANQTISAKEQTIESLEAQVEELQAQISGTESATDSAEAKVTSYQKLLAAYAYYVEESYEDSSEALALVDYDALDEEDQALYTSIQEEIANSEIKTLYKAATNYYSSGNYSSAIEKYLEAAAIDETYKNGELAYYLAFSYYYKENYSYALKWFKIAVNNLLDSEMITTSNNLISNITTWGYTEPTE